MRNTQQHRWLGDRANIDHHTTARLDDAVKALSTQEATFVAACTALCMMLLQQQTAHPQHRKHLHLLHLVLVLTLALILFSHICFSRGTKAK
jgi:hypothetical protein